MVDPFVSVDIEGKREGQRAQKMVDREPYSRTPDIKIMWIEPEAEKSRENSKTRGIKRKMTSKQRDMKPCRYMTYKILSLP